MSNRFEVIDRKSWVHKTNGNQVSIYGASPIPVSDYEIRVNGYTIRDNKTEEVGRPHGLTRIDRTNRDEVQALADRLNEMMPS